MLIRRLLMIAMPTVFLTASAVVTASAVNQPVPDFAPFTLRKDVWVAQLSSDGPGVESFVIEYRNADSWTVTTVGHTAQPAIAGSRWDYRAGTTTFYDAWRKVTVTYSGPNGVDHFIAPGLAQALANSASWRASPDVGGGLRLEHAARDSDGSLFTRALQFGQDGLPTVVEVRKDEKLFQRFTYSRP